MLKGQGGKFDAITPRAVIELNETRPHRPAPVWRDRATGEPVSEAERGELLDLAAPHILAGALSCDVTMRTAIKGLQQGDVEASEPSEVDEVERLAHKYLRWDGRPRRVLIAFIERAIDCPSGLSPGACLYSAASASCPPRNGSEWRPRRWRLATKLRLERGAGILVAIGSGRCAEGRCESSVSAEHRYCNEHGDEVHGQPGTLARSDREAVSGLLNAVGDALHIS